MENIDPAKVGFSDLPREIRDIIYAFALPTSEILCVNDNLPSPTEGIELECLEMSGISSIRVNGHGRTSSNLVFICRLVSAKVLSIFFQTYAFEFRNGNHLTYFLAKLRSNKVTQFLKYRVASAIGSLKFASCWIKRVRLQVQYLSTASIFWLCRHGIPEFQRNFPRLVDVVIGYNTLINITALRVHDVVKYMEGEVRNVPTMPYLPSREVVAAIFEGIVKSLWEDDQDGQVCIRLSYINTEQRSGFFSFSNSTTNL
jgi:hypothetical protein